jgi:hypothetical protein
MSGYKAAMGYLVKMAAAASLLLYSNCVNNPTSPQTTIENIENAGSGLPITFLDTLVKTENGVDLIFRPVKENTDSFYISLKWGDDTNTQNYRLKNDTELRIQHTGYVPCAKGNMKRNGEINSSSFSACLEDSLK